MNRDWMLRGGALVVLVSLALIAGLVRLEPAAPAPEQEAAPAPEREMPGEVATPVAEPPRQVASAEPLELVPAEPEPAHDWLRERSLALIAKYLEAADPEGLLARWQASSTHEAELVFASPDGSRFITLAAARADCADVDAFLREVGDPLVGVPALCKRWMSTAREQMRAHGLGGSPSRFLRERGVDTSVRVALLYAGWKRTGPGPESFRLVESHAVPVYPQSDFGVARRLALDGVMRDLGVGPYSDTPIRLVTALLRW